jgi:hypothetical protein
MFGRLLRLIVIGWIVSMVAAAIAAMSVKRRLIPTTDEGADEITAVAIFGPLAFHSTSQAFRGGEVECWYGGGVVDLRDAQLAPEGATLRVRAIFGGGQILVPASWKVVSRVAGLGGVQDIRAAQGHAAIDPELVIEGTLIAGGFAVSSEPAEGEDEWLDTLKERQADAAADAREAAANFEATPDSVTTVAEAVSEAADSAKSVTDDAKADAQEVVDTAREQATDAVEATAEAASEAGEEMAPAT